MAVNPVEPGPPAPKPDTAGSELDRLLWAISQQESGGNYSANNGIAVGKYQVLKSNVPDWTREALGRSMSWQQFIADHSAQDQVAAYKIGAYYRKYGIRGAASAWYSGDPKLSESTRPQSGGPSIKAYVDNIVALMRRAPGGGGGSPAPSGGGAGTGGGGGGGTSPGGVSQADLTTTFGQWIGSILAGSGDMALPGMLGTVLGPLGNLSKDLSQALAIAVHGLIWIVNPRNWLRIVAGVIGGAAAVIGTVLLMRAV